MRFARIDYVRIYLLIQCIYYVNLCILGKANATYGGKEGDTDAGESAEMG